MEGLNWSEGKGEITMMNELELQRARAALKAPLPKKKRPEPPKLTVVAFNEPSAEVLREKAIHAARDAARAFDRELVRCRPDGKVEALRDRLRVLSGEPREGESEAA